MTEGTTRNRWDVAISLLAEDEPLAERLVSHLTHHVRGEVFLYSRRQEEVARDGELVTLFTRVFGREAKIVVVLYRDGWGQTRYTALEEDAIRGRRLDERARRILIVSMDGGYPGAWYPADAFRPSPSEFSLGQIAALIAERVGEAGGRLGLEDPVAKSQRLQRERSKNEHLREVLASQGSQAFDREVAVVFKALEERSAQITAAGPDRLSFEERNRACCLNHRWGSLKCAWTRQYANSMDGTVLQFEILDVPISLSGQIRAGTPRRLAAGDFELVLPEADQWQWRMTSLDVGKPLTRDESSKSLADWLVSEMVEWTAGHTDPPPRPKPPRQPSGWLHGRGGSVW